MDILFDDDIKTKDGDFDTGNNTEFHAEAILKASKGNFFWNPTLGFGINSKINSDKSILQTQGEIVREFKKQDIQIVSFQTNEDGEFDINVSDL